MNKMVDGFRAKLTHDLCESIWTTSRCTSAEPRARFPFRAPRYPLFFLVGVLTDCLEGRYDYFSQDSHLMGSSYLIQSPMITITDCKYRIKKYRGFSISFIMELGYYYSLTCRHDTHDGNWDWGSGLWPVASGSDGGGSGPTPCCHVPRNTHVAGGGLACRQTGTGWGGAIIGFRVPENTKFLDKS